MRVAEAPKTKITRDVLQKRERENQKENGRKVGEKGEERVRKVGDFAGWGRQLAEPPVDYRNPTFFYLYQNPTLRCRSLLGK